MIQDSRCHVYVYAIVCYLFMVMLLFIICLCLGVPTNKSYRIPEFIRHVLLFIYVYVMFLLFLCLCYVFIICLCLGAPTNKSYIIPDSRCLNENDFPPKPQTWSNKLCAVNFHVSWSVFGAF